MTPFAFVFPGQGSQAVGMLDAWGDHPSIRQTLAEASEALEANISQLIAQGPKEKLDLTVNTQPIMLAASIACLNAWRVETGLEPALVAGHSLGEYTALVASGVLSLQKALLLVRFRAQAMQEAVPQGGGMAAILGLDAASVKEGCTEAMASSGEVVEAVNFNDPKQTVIAGTKIGVEHACEVLKSKGAKRALTLPVSAPFHSSLMRPAAEALKERLTSIEFLRPCIPVINNIDAASPSKTENIKDALYRQAFGPVRWVEVVKAIQTRGISCVVECGPGKVLAAMVRRIAPEMTGLPMFDPITLAQIKGILS